MKVFISHSSSDKWVARQIAKQLEERGINSFLDEKDIETGDSIDEAIQKHLADCDELLMLLSPAALDSPWVLIEVGGAKALKKRLVPILLHVGTNDLPGPLATGLARDLNDIDGYYQEIQRRSAAPSEPPSLAETGGRGRSGPRPKNFKVGELVRLPRAVPESTLGRDGREVGWNADMERYLGQVARITKVEREDWTSIDLDSEKWVWLMDWLEPAPSGDEAGG